MNRQVREPGGRGRLGAQVTKMRDGGADSGKEQWKKDDGGHR